MKRVFCDKYGNLAVGKPLLIEIESVQEDSDFHFYITANEQIGWALFIEDRCFGLFEYEQLENLEDLGEL